MMIHTVSVGFHVHQYAVHMPVGLQIAQTVAQPPRLISTLLQLIGDTVDGAPRFVIPLPIQLLYITWM